jgi:Domain of unknown function (DUF5615)
MRLLADENFPGTAVTALIEAGYDVVWVRNAAPGMSDPDVLAWARHDGRILLTFDKDFGELAKALALPSTCGVVLFPMPMPKPSDIGSRLRDLVKSREIGPATSLSSNPAVFECASSGSALVRIGGKA